MTNRRLIALTLTVAGLLATSSVPLLAQRPIAPAYTHSVPHGQRPNALPMQRVTRITVPRIDPRIVTAEDARRDGPGRPMRYAIPNAVRVNLTTQGTWETLPDGTRVCRLRVGAPGAASINFGFESFALPPKSRLLIYSPDFQYRMRPFTKGDNKPHGQLWTPVLPGEEAVLELTIPRNTKPPAALTITHVGYGYRGLGAPRGGGLSGTEFGPCDIDIVCPQGRPWQNEIDTVAVFSLQGSLACTGFMINNTAQNLRPFFLTAAHCGLDSSTAPSLVVYWNYQKTRCGGARDGSLRDFQNGSTVLAAWGASDFTLAELDASPNPAWNVKFAGWDRSGVNTPGAVAIHQPGTEEKVISFENHTTHTTSYFGNSIPGDGTHVRVLDWDVGSTEPGSSGSPLFDLNHRAIGQLHGGTAACGNNDPDWYGRISVSWTGGGTPTTRLSDWLDPLGTGAMTIDTLGPKLRVEPTQGVMHRGPFGGPFSNPSTTYMLTNRTGAAIQYEVRTPTANQLLLDGGTAPVTGTLAPNSNRVVTITLAPSANRLTPGIYENALEFRDITNSLTNHKQHTIEIGRATIYSFNFDQNPGWTKQGNWNFGRPQGLGGGSNGNPDPRSGRTGANVWGFNLAGDYPSDLPQRHLTSNALDCSGLSGVRVKFWRWLNVEDPEYDHARFRVSTDGTTWRTVWENSAEVIDSRWILMNLDISNIADGKPTVFLRWTMGTTDNSVEYSGWNIDDVSITGITLGYFSNYGNGCASSTGRPVLRGSGLLAPGGTVDLRITGGAPNGTAALLASPAPDIPGTACLHVTSPFLGPLMLPLDGNGAADLQSVLPASSPRNVHIYLQAITIGPTGAASTNGVDAFVK